MHKTEQQFLKALDDKLWKAADKLRANLDAANYKHVVLGLIFLKYVSDAFEERQEELLELFKTDSDDNIYYMPREDFDGDEEYQQALTEELEVLDYYRSLARRCRERCKTAFRLLADRQRPGRHRKEQRQAQGHS